MERPKPVRQLENYVVRKMPNGMFQVIHKHTGRIHSFGTNQQKAKLQAELLERMKYC